MATTSPSYRRPLPTPPPQPTTPVLHPPSPVPAPAPAPAASTSSSAQPPSEAPLAPSTVSASQISGGTEPIVCNGCKHGLEETGDSVVVSFGSSLWHVDCFRCAKCHNLVEHDTNLLLLSDGSPVCENCSYICSVCQKPISNEAIVTGDESYHADCFRCRSCHNKIEELIFAKTSQGIWCMSCHNERVARSRKNAEVKRSRSARRDKEGRPHRSRGERGERSEKTERPGTASAPLTAASDTTTFDLDSPGGVDSSPRPLPPSPYPNSSPSSDPPPNGTTTSSSRGTNSSAGRSRFPSGTDASEVPPSSSSHSLSTLARGASPSNAAPLHSRLNSGHQTDMDRTASQTSFASSDPSGSRPGGSSRPGTADAAARAASPAGLRNPFATSGSTDHLAADASDRGPSPTPSGSRNGALSAPPANDKASNRRSGFYGSFRRPSIEEDESGLEADDDADATSVLDATPSVSSLSPAVPQTVSFLPELHNSMSFYDPDTLLFLDHVAQEPPSTAPTSHALARSLSNGIVDVPADQVEHLSPTLGAIEASSDDEMRRERPPKSEVATKLRESIRTSREGSAAAGGGMSMDVELVEMLLSELDGTRREMQSLQSKYNAFRRASRSAFEGFSMAHEEYDKEVAARRDAEAKMDRLRHKFAEQALKLAAVDKEQQTAEALSRRSKELRSSVVGMEKHLSHLRAQVELSTAEIEELAVVDKSNATPDRPATTVPNHGDIERSLTARLEAVKDVHRSEIEALVQQRDGLAREIAELRQTRDIFAEEAAALNLQNSTLADQNAEAARELDSAREAALHSRATRNLLRHDENSGHQHSGSLSSVTLVSNSRTPTAVAHDVEAPHRLAKADPEPRSVTKKFGWGKGKHEPTRPSHAPAGSTSKALPPSRPNGVVEAAPRTHAFQQTSILRPIRCEYCGDKMWGLNEVRCTGCGTYSHAKCAGYLTATCTPNGPTPIAQDDTLNLTPVMFGNDLTAQAKVEGRQVPVVVSKCIGAVEAYGMNYEGIYRKTGGSGQTKLITACFERGQDFNLEDADKFNDLAAVTSCMKNFFRSLPDPLFTHDRHEKFVECVEMPEGEARLVALEQAIYSLPEAHFYTARMLLGHLHRVHLRSSENKMTPTNLGVVFGPTVLRSRNASREFSDMGFKAKLVELMVEQQPRLFAKPYRAPDDPAWS